MPTYVVTDPKTGRKLRLTGDSPPTDEDLDEIFSSLPIKEESKEIAEPEQEGKSAIDSILDPIYEGGAAISRGVTGLMDMAELGTVGGQINRLLEETGRDRISPKASELAAMAGMTAPNYMEEGLARDVVQQVGEMTPAMMVGGGATRGLASMMPKVGFSGNAAAPLAGESLTSGVVRQIGTSTPAQDVGYGALSTAGGVVGEDVGGDTGAMIGAIAAPVTVSGGALALNKALGMGKSGIEALFGATKGVSEDGAATMLAEAMVREGLSPNDVAAKMTAMGDEGMLADVGNNFARLLRVASNKIPAIEGQAGQAFAKRQSGQGQRISDALDDGTGTPLLTVDDEIARLENTMGPKIKDMYTAAKDRPIQVSNRLKILMDGDNAIGRAATEAKKNLADYRAIGEEVTNMSLIDETKKVLDAQIGKAVRDGDKGTASRMLQLKKVMVSEADAASPEYAKARSMFAGKEQLKNAADLGESFFKTNSRELKQLTDTFGESERRMYKLGAKQAILDRFNNINANADLVSRTFGKNGDVDKLRTLFDTPDQFNQFRQTLEREANWTLTRRAAQANSTTAKQINDDITAQDAFAFGRDVLSNPVSAANAMGKIMGGLSKKRGEAEFTRALEQTGDILLEAGMNPDAVRSLLIKGQPELIKRALDNQINRKFSKAVPIGVGTLGSQIENSQEASQ